MSRPRHTMVGAGLALAALVALPLHAQSSLFGVRGLGQPGRPLSVGTRATGGSFGLFDGESDLNPAALVGLRAVSAGLVATPSWRHWETPAGSASLRETRFPLIHLGGPVPNTRLGLGIAIGSYADRDFKLASVDTVMLRGVPVEAFDTLQSLGGLNEVRFAAGYQLSAGTAIGVGVHWITGSSRMRARRTFSDSLFIPVAQTAELSYQGAGFSLGLTQQVGPRAQVALLVRSDTRASVDLDSASAYTVDLPWTFAAGAQLHPSPRLTVAASGQLRTWSGANSDLLAQGGLGAMNTLELNFGAEYLRNRRAPYSLPIRAGVRYAQLPFPLTPGVRPHEFGISAGTGTRFAQDRAAVDLALEQTWRSDGQGFKERAFTLIFGLSIRPYGVSQ